MIVRKWTALLKQGILDKVKRWPIRLLKLWSNGSASCCLSIFLLWDHNIPETLHTLLLITLCILLTLFTTNVCMNPHYSSSRLSFLICSHFLPQMVTQWHSMKNLCGCQESMTATYLCTLGQQGNSSQDTTVSLECCNGNVDHCVCAVATVIPLCSLYLVD